MADLPRNTSYGSGSAFKLPAISDITAKVQQSAQIRDRLSKQLEERITGSQAPQNADAPAAPTNRGFGNVDAEQAKAVSQQWGGKMAPAGVPAMASPTAGQVTDLPSGSTFQVKPADQNGIDVQAPPSGTKGYALRGPEGGSIMVYPQGTDTTKTLYQTTRGNQPKVDEAIIGSGLRTGKGVGSGEIDHIIPVWLGGLDEASNKQYLPIEKHERKNKVDSAAEVLFRNGLISRNDAVNLLRNYEYLPVDGLEENGFNRWPTTDQAKAWLDGIRDKTPHVGMASVVDSLRDVGADLPDNVVGNLAKGLLQGLTFGVAASGSRNVQGLKQTPANYVEPPKGLANNAARIVGNVAGSLVPIEGFLSPLVRGAIGIAAPSLVATSSAARLASAANVTSREILTPGLTAASLLTNSLANVGYGQVASTFEEDAGFGGRFKRALLDTAYGSMGAVFPKKVTVAGRELYPQIPAVATANYALARLSGSNSYDAMVNSLVGTAMHVASGAGNHEAQSRSAKDSAESYLASMGIPAPKDGRGYTQELFDAYEKPNQGFIGPNGKPVSYVEWALGQPFDPSSEQSGKPVPAEASSRPSTVPKEAQADELGRYIVARNYLLSHQTTPPLKATGTIPQVWSGLFRKPMDTLLGKPAAETFEGSSGRLNEAPSRQYGVSEMNFAQSVSNFMSLRKMAKEGTMSQLTGLSGRTNAAALASYGLKYQGHYDESSAVPVMATPNSRMGEAAYQELSKHNMSGGVSVMDKDPLSSNPFRAFAVKDVGLDGKPQVNVYVLSKATPGWDSRTYGPFATYTGDEIAKASSQALSRSMDRDSLHAKMEAMGVDVLPLTTVRVNAKMDKELPFGLHLAITPEDEQFALNWQREGTIEDYRTQMAERFSQLQVKSKEEGEKSHAGALEGDKVKEADAGTVPAEGQGEIPQPEPEANPPQAPLKTEIKPKKPKRSKTKRQLTEEEAIVKDPKYAQAREEYSALSPEQRAAERARLEEMLKLPPCN